MRDFIELADLPGRTVIGVSDEERREPQEVRVSLTLWTDAKRGSAADRIEDTLDYDRVARRTLEIVERSEFRLLESLAEAVAKACVLDFAVPRVRVRVTKPAVYRGVSVTVERDAADYARPAP